MKGSASWSGHHDRHAPGHSWSKGWGKRCEGSSSTSGSMSSTSGSDVWEVEEDGRGAGKHKSKQADKEMRECRKKAKQAVRHARQECKRAMHESKKQFKEQRKAAKKVLKEVTKGQREKFKATMKARRHGRQESTAYSSPSSSTMCTPMQEAGPAPVTMYEENTTSIMHGPFPVEIGDGRRLEISWNRDDSPQKVASLFAEQNYLQSDEIPTIVAFVEQANASMGDNDKALAPQADEKMDVSEETPCNPPCYDEQLQALEQMGFPDRDLNIQLLAAHDGNLQKVIEQMI